MKVMILLGSESDFNVIEDAISIFKQFEIPFAVEVSSAHRTPERTVRLIKEAEEKGAEIFIAVAGKAAHLPGVVAAHTIKPVIGVPVESQALAGLDALLSIVQMPRGVPVAGMALGKAGGSNAALLAVAILALSDQKIARALKAFREATVAAVEAASKKLQEKL